MPDKSFSEVWLLGPWTGFAFDLVGLVLTISALVVTTGARKAAREASQKLKNFDRSIDATRMVDSMANLKRHLREGDFNSASHLCDQLRTECVRLKSDVELIAAIGFSNEIDSLITFFGSTEEHIQLGGFLLNTEAFNNKQDDLLLISEKIKGIGKR